MDTRRRFLPAAIAASLLLAAFAACDKTSPVAPSGTLITISANPDRIPSDGSAEIRVVALRPNGTPVSRGTLVRLTTTLGSIPPSVGVDDRGEALAMLQADGQFGVARVSASTGGSETATIDVQLGLSPASVTVQVTPNSVPETGGEAELLAIVRDDRGQPLEKAEVNFRTEIGTLDSGGTLIPTAADGTASDRLIVTSGDLDTVSGDSFQVGVDVGSGGGGLVTTNVSVAIQRLPRADFTFNTRNLLVAFEDTTDGRTTSWLWSFGDGNTSTRQNPTHTYDQPGTYAVTFRATNSLGSDEVTKFVQVTGQ